MIRALVVLCLASPAAAQDIDAELGDCLDAVLGGPAPSSERIAYERFAPDDASQGRARILCEIDARGPRAVPALRRFLNANAETLGRAYNLGAMLPSVPLNLGYCASSGDRIQASAYRGGPFSGWEISFSTNFAQDWPC